MCSTIAIKKNDSDLERPLLCRAREERLLSFFFTIVFTPKLIRAWIEKVFAGFLLIDISEPAHKNRNGEILY